MQSPELFTKVADEVASRDLSSFGLKSLTTILSAYASAKYESSPLLFEKICEAIVGRKANVSNQTLPNILWAYAVFGYVKSPIFLAMAPRVMTVLHKCNCESLTIIAWSYAAANVDDPMLFNERFLNALLEKMDSFNVIQLTRLHQWHLWRQEKSSSIRLPPAFETKCYGAFISEEPTVSSFQKEVMARLRVLGLRPKEEELTKIGYSLDAIVEVNGKQLGVEVDGPSHFIGKIDFENRMRELSRPETQC